MASSRQADPEAVKLPFPIVLERLRRDGLDPREPPLRGKTGAIRDRRASPSRTSTSTSASGRSCAAWTPRWGAAETIAVLGPNGSGKTTLFRSAMQLVKPRAGRITVDGRDAAGTPIAELARSIGYVFQSPSQMLFARSVREELLFGPRNLELPMDDPDAVALEALRRTGLDEEEGILDRPPLTLSFGQQKRLALAIGLALRAAHPDPRRAVGGAGSPNGVGLHGVGGTHPGAGEPLLRHARRGPCAHARGPYSCAA